MPEGGELAEERRTIQAERDRLDADRAVFERERLDNARGRSRFWTTWGAVVPAFAIAASILIAGCQISAERKAADRRASEEREQQRERDRSELRLAAISVVLAAPTCVAAEARASLASAVLGPDVVGRDFVKNVQQVQVVAFPDVVPTPFPFKNSAASTFFKVRPTLTQMARLNRQYRAAIEKAQKNRRLLCNQLRS